MCILRMGAEVAPATVDWCQDPRTCQRSWHYGEGDNEPCPRAMFVSSCNVTQSRLPSDVECRGKVLSCDDWPFRGASESQGVFGPSFHKGCSCQCYVVDSSTCFRSVHIGEPSTDLTNLLLVVPCLLLFISLLIQLYWYCYGRYLLG